MPEPEEKRSSADVTTSVSLVVPSFRTWVMEVFVTEFEMRREIQWHILPVLAIRSRVSSDFSKFVPVGAVLDTYTHTPNSCRQFLEEGWAAEGESLSTELMVPALAGEGVEAFECDSDLSRYAIIVDHMPGVAVKGQAAKILKKLVNELVTAHKLPPGTDVSEYVE